MVSDLGDFETNTATATRQIFMSISNFIAVANLTQMTMKHQNTFSNEMRLVT